MKRDEFLTLRLTKAEKDKIERAAKRDKRTASDWARLALVEQAKKKGA